jgi:hypothetical protein
VTEEEQEVGLELERGTSKAILQTDEDLEPGNRRQDLRRPYGTRRGKYKEVCGIL